MASYCKIFNDSGFDSSFSVQWDGGQTDRTIVAPGGNFAVYIDLTKYIIPSGTSCWVRAYVQGGPNHDSGDNFNYDGNGKTAVYTITGTTLNPSFNYLGEQSLAAQKADDLVVTKGPARGIQIRQQSTTDDPSSAPRRPAKLTVTVEYT